MDDSEIIMVKLRCRLERDDNCERESSYTVPIKRGTPPPTFQCKNCAGKFDKLGRFRKSRPRNSLSLDHPEFRTDDRRAIKKPSGMTEARYKHEYPQGPEVSAGQRIRENVVEFLTVVTDPEERRILELFQEGKSYREISEALALEGIKCSKPNVPLRLNKIVAEARRKLAATAGRSPEIGMEPPRGARGASLDSFEESQFANSLRVPVPGEELIFPKYGESPYRVNSEETVEPLDKIENMNLDDLDSEAMDYVLGLDVEDELSASELGA